MRLDEKKYLINFIILFFIIYLILKVFENYISIIISKIVSFLLNISYKGSILYYNSTIFYISSACTCTFEISLFLAYIFATPKVNLKFKIIYSIFGLGLINLANIIRIILIIKYSQIFNYWFVHDTISFIIFVVAIFLNLGWVITLKKLGVVKG